MNQQIRHSNQSPLLRLSGVLISVLWMLFSFCYVYTFVSNHVIKDTQGHSLYQTDASGNRHSEEGGHCYHLDFLLSLAFLDNTPIHIEKPLCIITTMNAAFVEHLYIVDVPEHSLRGPPQA